MLKVAGAMALAAGLILLICSAISALSSRLKKKRPDLISGPDKIDRRERAAYFLEVIRQSRRRHSEER
jgi:hypothetical protein